MNKILKTTAAPTLGSCSYESPMATVADLVSEGMLCTSGDMSVKPWEDGEFDW